MASGSSATADRLASYTNSAVASEAHIRNVSQTSTVNWSVPRRITSASPTMRDSRPPTGVVCSRAIGHPRTPRNASACTLLRMRGMVRSRHQRFTARADSISSTPPK